VHRHPACDGGRPKDAHCSTFVPVVLGGTLGAGGPQVCAACLTALRSAWDRGAGAGPGRLGRLRLGETALLQGCASGTGGQGPQHWCASPRGGPSATCTLCLGL